MLLKEYLTIMEYATEYTERDQLFFENIVEMLRQNHPEIDEIRLEVREEHPSSLIIYHECEKCGEFPIDTFHL